MAKETSLKKFNDFLKRMDPRRGRQESSPRGNDRFPRSSSVPPNEDRSFPTYGIPITITTTDIPTDTVFSPSRVQVGGTAGLPSKPTPLRSLERFIPAGLVQRIYGTLFRSL